MEPNDGVTADLRHGGRDHHDHDRPAGQRPGPAGLGAGAAGDAVPGSRARPGHRHRGRSTSCCIAIGYLAILVAEGLNTTARWTRGLSRDSADGFGTATPVVWRAAGYLAVPALVGPIVLGVALPTLSLPGFGFGSGAGGGPLQLTDPTLDLRRNLNQPDDRVVLEYQSDSPGGLYLRMASLPQLNAAGWSNVQIRLSSGNELGAIPGLTRNPIRRSAGGPRSGCSTSARSTCRCRTRRAASRPTATGASTRTRWWWSTPATGRRIFGSSATRWRASTSRPSAEELADAAVGTPPDGDVTAAIPRDLPGVVDRADPAR